MKKQDVMVIVTAVLILGISVLDAAVKVILGYYDLQFRPWIETLGYALRCVLVLLLLAMLLLAFWNWMRGKNKAVHKMIGGIGLVIGSVGFFALLIGALWFGILFYKKESIAVVEDKKCLVCEHETPDYTSWSYYEYKGWFVMGEDIIDYKTEDR